MAKGEKTVYDEKCEDCRLSWRVHLQGDAEKFDTKARKWIRCVKFVEPKPGK